MKYPKLPPNKDRRVKITPDQYDKVKTQYKKLGSFRAVARLYNVDRGTIKAIINPAWYKEKQQKRYKQKPWREYYKQQQGEQWNKIMREHRRYKYEVQPEDVRQHRHAKRGKIFETKTCIVCGEEFWPANTKQKVCPRRVRPCYWKIYKRPKRKKDDKQ